MLDSLFQMELPLPVKLVVAFAIVLLLLALVMWIFKKLGGNRLGAPAARGRQPRLAVIDAAAVDGRRRLVLIRRDNVEHLIMIGGPTDVVVEQNIMRAVPVAPQREAGPPTRMPAEPPMRPHEPPPRPPREPRPDPLGLTEPPPPPRAPRDMPPPPPPRRVAEGDRMRSAPPDLRAQRMPPVGMRGEPSFSPGEPSPAAQSEVALSDMANKLEAALRRPVAGGRRAEPPPMTPPPALPEPPPPTAPELNGNGGRASAPLPPLPPAPPPLPPAAPVSAALSPIEAKPGTPAQGDAKPGTQALLDSLEEEMSSLISKPPEKK